MYIKRGAVSVTQKRKRGFIMSNIYYPYFKIEEGKKNERCNHKRNIRLLALVSGKIMIPARQLLEMDNDQFDILLGLKKLFDKKVIYTRLPCGCKGLREYYEDRKDDFTKSPPEVTDIRINKIVTELYAGQTEFDEYNTLEQQGYYSEQFGRFISAYIQEHRRVKGREKLEKYISENEANQKLNIKEEVDPYLYELKKSRAIGDKTYKTLKKASDVIYFVAGASTQQLKICLDPNSISGSMGKELENTISGYTNIVNKNYAPEKIIEWMQELEIINEKSDLDHISVDEILYLRNIKCFRKFVKKYEKISEANDNEKYFESLKKRLKYLNKVKYGGVEFVLTVLAAAISWIFFKSFLWSLAATIGFGAISSLLLYILTKRWHYEIPLVEGVIDEIMDLIDPVTLYLSKVKWIISKDNE